LGSGYYVVTTAGVVYAFGDAVSYGEPGPQASPVTSAVRTPDGAGYRILFADRVVAPYGEALGYGGPVGAVNPLNPGTGYLHRFRRHWLLGSFGKRLCVYVRRRSVPRRREYDAPQRFDYRCDGVVGPRVCVWVIEPGPGPVVNVPRQSPSRIDPSDDGSVVDAIGPC
jgi:hypothetical protein